MRYAAAVALILVACAEDPLRPPRPPPPHSVVGTVSVAPGADSARPSDSVVFLATVRDTLGAVRTDFAVTWISSDTSIAKVSASGVVHARKSGLSTIRATVEDSISGEATITVFPELQIAGVWDYRQVVTDTSWGITCADTGSFVITQADYLDGTAEKTGSCPNIKFGTGGIYGRVIGSQVEIGTEETQCYYHGVADLPAADTLRGTLECYLSNVYNFHGTWTATHGAPVASVTIAPALKRLVPAGATQLTTVMFDALGNRVFGRLPSWTSDDPSVATVSGMGAVTAVTTGSTTIRASIAGASPGSATVAISQVSFTELAAGSEFVCGITTTGTACWGDDRYGALGDGWRALSSTPVPLDSEPRFISLTTKASASHVCGITGIGAAYCWGNNYFGQLGDGSKNNRNVPVPVSGGHVFTSIAPGTTFTCALAADSTAWCWGSNGGGELGRYGPPYPAISESLTPLQVSDTLKFISLTAEYRHTCGLTAAGDVWCWGLYAVAVNSVPGVTERPAKVQGGITFVSLSGGSSHDCGLTSGGQAYCWGSAERGQLGTGSYSDSMVPQPVSGGRTFASIHAARESTCALTTGGLAYCWGRNGANLGIGADDPATETLAPAPVLGGFTFVNLSVGGAVTCGLTPALVTYCWGWGIGGALGDGSTTSVSGPVRVAGQP